MDTILSLLERMKEPSSYAGLGVLLGVFGIKMVPEKFTAIVTVATAVCGLIAIFIRERKPTTK